MIFHVNNLGLESPGEPTSGHHHSTASSSNKTKGVNGCSGQFYVCAPMSGINSLAVSKPQSMEGRAETTALHTN